MCWCCLPIGTVIDTPMPIILMAMRGWRLQPRLYWGHFWRYSVWYCWWRQQCDCNNPTHWWQSTPWRSIAVFALVAKESLFRYMLAVAKRVRSQMLVANAWHARSDAASSLVVIVGVAGNLLGFTFLDLVAAAVVGVMIAHMGGKLAFEAMAELIDTGLDEEEVEAIKKTLLNTHGVRSLHELRTRKMADNALVDAHIIVDPKVSVSEGHYIAEAARNAVLKNHHVMDVMVHIDPEDDLQAKPNVHLPSRPDLMKCLAGRLTGLNLQENRVVFHYLDGKVDAEIFLNANQQADNLQARCDDLVREEEIFRGIQIHYRNAQK